MKSSFQALLEHFNSLFQSIEDKVEDREGAYKNLSAEALYTSWEDLKTIFNHPLVSGSFADLGCGMGLPSIFYGHSHPQFKSYGIEFDSSRVESGKELIKKFGLTNIELTHNDLLVCPLPVADVYFIYLPTGFVLDRILSELHRIPHQFYLIIIESHGDLIARIELENWLELIDEIPLQAARHYPNAKLYRRNFERRSSILIPFQHSFKDHYLLVEDISGSWLGNTLGMEWTRDDRFQLKTPPRTILWSDVKKLMTFQELSGLEQKVILLRDQGEVTVRLAERSFIGFIRKITLLPTFGLEISTGERVQWEEILSIHQGLRICYESSRGFYF